MQAEKVIDQLDCLAVKARMIGDETDGQTRFIQGLTSDMSTLEGRLDTNIGRVRRL